jgi:hypothetical protein
MNATQVPGIIPLRPRRVLLDTNAVGSLYESRQRRSLDDLAIVRDLLADRVRNGSVQVVIAYRLLEEYAPVQRFDPARYMATLDYLQRLVGPHLLLPTDQLVEREARCRRRLRYHESIFDPATRDGLWGIARSREALEATAPELEEMKNKHAASMVRNRERAHEIYFEKRLGETLSKSGSKILPVDEATRIWGKTEVRAQLDGWTLDTLKQMIADRKLIPPEAADLPASAVPTLRAMTAYYMARIVQNVGYRARIKPSDLFDHYHYSSAVYADLIVSDDSDFTRTVKIIDDKPIQTFDELRTSLLRGLCGPVADLSQAQ